MKISRAYPRFLAGGLAVLTLVSAGLAAAPVPAAQAQSGYRLCGLWNSAKQPGQIGAGMVSKVRKGDDRGCAGNLEHMAQDYYRAYNGSSPDHKFSMMTCEEFRDRVALGEGGDPCYLLTEYATYKFTSPSDRIHPNPLNFTLWYG